MENIAFYGKGGIGKSTVAAGVSLSLALSGKRVLHVGCDPKHDSTAVLARKGPAVTVLDQLFRRPVEALRREDIVMPGIHNIDCVEAGGPQSGVGCGGRAVSRMFEIFEQLSILDPKRYDVAVFDVLGDVVCGGFAAPLRAGIAPKVVIVASEEMMAGYAANNIAGAVKHYAQNGVCLAGMVINLRDNQADRAPIRRLARRLGTRILAEIPRSPAIQRAELDRRSVVEAAPRSDAARAIAGLADRILRLGRRQCRAPRPLDLEGVRAVMRGT
jgi:nitrogenase iron protein NifH